MITKEHKLNVYASGVEATDETMEKYMPLVRHIASKYTYNLPSPVDYDDLVSMGLVGLLDAISRFDPSRGIKFETFATYRVRGTILNQLSALSWIPRSVREKSRKLEKTITELHEKFGRIPTNEEIAGSAGLSISQYEKMLTDTAPVSFIPVYSTDDGDESDPGLYSTSECPAKLAEDALRVNRVASCLKELPEKERLTATLYFYEDMTLKEIGQILGVSESRSCQLLSQAMLKVRAMVGKEGEL